MLTRTFTYLRSHHIALLALFVALGGSAYAASQVGSKSIKDESIRSVDIKDDALRGADLGENSVGASHLKAGATEVSHATVIVDSKGNPALLPSATGFTGVDHDATGIYRFTFDSSAPTCDIVTSLGQPTGVKAPAVSISQVSSGASQLFIQLGKANGDKVDLGTGGFPYYGFSIAGFKCAGQ